MRDAFASLDEALAELGDVEKIARLSHKNPERVYRTYRDSMIQRFEYTFDVTWKFLSDYLQAEGRSLPIKTPKAIFRECYKATLLSDSDVRLALQMVDHRNLTTHGYDEALIEEIAKQIPSYAALLEKMVALIKLA